MVDVSVTISGIIMCCDESICGLNFGRGYTVEKCNLDTLFFKAKITNGQGNLNTDYFGSRIIENGKVSFICLKKEAVIQIEGPSFSETKLEITDKDCMCEDELQEYMDKEMEYLNERINSHIEYLERFIDQLRETKNFKFIGAYFDVTTEMPNYIKYLNIRWSEVFYTVLEEKNLSEKQIREYSIFSIYYSDDDTIKLINQDSCLCNYISNARDYLAIDEPDIDKLIHGFSLLGICFIGFDYETLNKDLFYAVYEESLYEINAENLRLIQTEILGVKNDEDIVHKNYTLLLLHSDSAITQYVNQNINKYFDVVLQISGGTILDDENVAIAVLNNPDLTVECKHSYISALRTSIVLIKAIDDIALWSPLLNADIVQYSERNIMDCFNAVKLNESVISYINRCDIDLDFSKAEYDEDTKGRLFDSVIICNDIDNSKYKQILVSLKFIYDNFDIAEISDDKITMVYRRSGIDDCSVAAKDGIIRICRSLARGIRILRCKIVLSVIKFFGHAHSTCR